MSILHPLAAGNAPATSTVQTEANVRGFFHYTSRHHLGRILENGISRGKVQCTWQTTSDAVWITLDGNPNRQTWDAGVERRMTADERRRLMALDRIWIPENSFWPNKREYRLTLRVPANDPHLIRYVDYAREHVCPSVDRRIRKTAPGCNPRDWHLYLGTIPTEWIIAVDRFPTPANSNILAEMLMK